jgi:hypothetical protein
MIPVPGATVQHRLATIVCVLMTERQCVHLSEDLSLEACTRATAKKGDNFLGPAYLTKTAEDLPLTEATIEVYPCHTGNLRATLSTFIIPAHLTRLAQCIYRNEIPSHHSSLDTLSHPVMAKMDLDRTLNLL